MLREFASKPDTSFTRMDALMLAAAAEGRREPVSLAKLIERIDWLGRVVPTFEELSYGANRLKAAGLIDVYPVASGEVTFAPTSRARELWRSVRPQGRAPLVEAIAEVLGAARYPDDEVENRSLGPLPGLTSDAVEAAVRAHAQDVDWFSKRIASVVRRIGSLMGWDRPTP